MATLSPFPSPASALDQLSQRIIACRQCPRLVNWREEVARKKKRAYQDEEYWGKPVPGFGDPLARVLVIGLAPGAHGSNRTGRNFTGDASGDFLYPALYRAGFGNQPVVHDRNDGLVLHDLYIAAACRCVPPDNNPTSVELATCRPFLEEEIRLLPRLEGFVALGRIAFDWLLTWYRQQGAEVNGLTFAHASLYHPARGLPWLAASYHPSRQNTQTGRLTATMFDQVWQMARTALDGANG
jgi:uracil-DNA glycosylase family 4